jgi:3-oxoacyl-[acyl-carrier-protein] synthase II
MLERASDAVSRGTIPFARLAGWDQRADAHHITGADPTGNVLSLAVERTLSMAQWSPSDVQYINAHGTGTLLNDRVEAAAIRRVFGSKCPPVSSLKGHMGHLLGASSAAELAIAVQCARYGFLPPTLGLDDPDPELDLNFVPDKGISGSGIKRILKISLGFGGHIAVMAVEIL